MTARRPRSLSVVSNDRVNAVEEDQKSMCTATAEPAAKARRGTRISRLIDDLSKRGRRSSFSKSGDEPFEDDDRRPLARSSSRAAKRGPRTSGDDDSSSVSFANRSGSSRGRASSTPEEPHRSTWRARDRRANQDTLHGDHDNSSRSRSRSRRSNQESTHTDDSSHGILAASSRPHRGERFEGSSRSCELMSSEGRRTSSLRTEDAVSMLSSECLLHRPDQSHYSGEREDGRQARRERDVDRDRRRSRSTSRNREIVSTNPLFSEGFLLGPDPTDIARSRECERGRRHCGGESDNGAPRHRRRSTSRDRRPATTSDPDESLPPNIKDSIPAVFTEAPDSTSHKKSREERDRVKPRDRNRDRSRSRSEGRPVAAANEESYLEPTGAPATSQSTACRTRHGAKDTDSRRDRVRSKSRSRGEESSYASERTREHDIFRGADVVQDTHSKDPESPPRSQNDFDVPRKDDLNRIISRTRRNESTECERRIAQCQGSETASSDDNIGAKVASSHTPKVNLVEGNAQPSASGPPDNSIATPVPLPDTVSSHDLSHQQRLLPLPIEPLWYTREPLTSLEDLLQRCDVAKAERWVGHNLCLATIRNRLGFQLENGKVASVWVSHLKTLFLDFIAEVDGAGDSSIYLQAIIESSTHEPEAAVLILQFLSLLDGLNRDPETVAIADYVAKIPTIACWCREIIRYPNDFPDVLLECCLAHLQRFPRILDRHERLQHILCIIFRGSKHKSALEELRHDVLGLFNRKDGAGFMTMSRALYLQSSVEMAVGGVEKITWTEESSDKLRQVLECHRDKGLPTAMFRQLERQLLPFCSASLCFTRGQVQCCGRAFYCSQTCRDSDWQRHKRCCHNGEITTLPFEVVEVDSPMKTMTGFPEPLDLLKTPKTPNMRFQTIGGFDDFLVAPLSTPKKQRQPTAALIKQNRALRETRDTDYVVFQSWGKLSLQLNPPTKDEFQELRLNAMESNDDVEEMFELLSRLCPVLKESIKSQLEDEYAIALRNPESPAVEAKYRSHLHASKAVPGNVGKTEDTQEDQEQLQRLYEHQLQLQRIRQVEQERQLLLLYQQHKRLEGLRMGQQDQLQQQQEEPQSEQQHQSQFQQQQQASSLQRNSGHAQLERRRVDRRRGQHESVWDARRSRSKQV